MAHCGLCRAVPGCPLESDRQSPGAGSPRADIGPHRATPFKANTELLMERLFLIDAYALIFRAYYAFIGRPMRNSEGLNTSAIFGFVKFLRDLIRREEPRLLGVAFDPKGGNFRHEIYPQYKANREATPEDIIAAVPYIKRVLEAMRIPVIEVPGYEADDVIGTLSMKAAGAGYEVYMVTPDKDYGQLIRPTVRIYKQRKGGDGIEVIGCEQIREHYGIDDPCRVIDILALWGDASDNIPGVPGIGEKSAIKLVCEFGTVENLLENTDKLKGKQRENIEALREQILLAKRLATIELNVPVEFDPAGLTMENPRSRDAGRCLPGAGGSVRSSMNCRAIRSLRRRALQAPHPVPDGKCRSGDRTRFGHYGYRRNCRWGRDNRNAGSFGWPESGRCRQPGVGKCRAGCIAGFAVRCVRAGSGCRGRVSRGR